MCPKGSFGIWMTVLLSITVWVCFLSCGDIDLDIDQEQTEEPLRFIEFVLFPTAPYVDKSYIEKVPEDEIAFRGVDFETEKAAIQKVYKAFIKAFVAEDMTALRETLDTAAGIEYGTTTGIVYGWNNIKIYLHARWEKLDCQAAGTWKLVDFYIRPKNVRTPGTEASAQGPAFYYTPGIGNPRCYEALSEDRSSIRRNHSFQLKALKS